jgi:hypothetical protein
MRIRIELFTLMRFQISNPGGNSEATLVVTLKGAENRAVFDFRFLVRIFYFINSGFGFLLLLTVRQYYMILVQFSLLAAPTSPLNATRCSVYVLVKQNNKMPFSPRVCGEYELTLLGRVLCCDMFSAVYPVT